MVQVALNEKNLPTKIKIIEVDQETKMKHPFID